MFETPTQVTKVFGTSPLGRVIVQKLTNDESLHLFSAVSGVLSVDLDPL